MRRVLPLIVLAAGCVGPGQVPPDPAALPTGDVREREAKMNLCDGLTWEEHERRIADLKAALGRPADGDATGPATPVTSGPGRASSRTP